jgi:RNA polymerase sigma-70 factor (ECF subfamily)
MDIALPDLAFAAREAPAARRAFELFVAEHRGELAGRARKICRQHVDPDDLVQDTLERAWRGFSGLRDGERSRAWLFTILHHTFIDRLRRQKAAPVTTPVDEAQLASPAPAPRADWERLTPADLEAAMDRLPAEVRDIYRQHALEGRDYVWLAETHRMPKNTVGTRLLRARRLLKEMLSKTLATREGGLP